MTEKLRFFGEKVGDLDAEAGAVEEARRLGVEEAHRHGKLSYKEFSDRMVADLTGDVLKVDEINTKVRVRKICEKLHQNFTASREEIGKATAEIIDHLQFQLTCREKDVIGYQRQADEAIGKMLESDKKIRELEKQLAAEKADRGFIVNRVSDLALEWREVDSKRECALDLFQRLKDAVEGKV